MNKTNTSGPFQGQQLYRAVWRWHFYAGLFVIPFLMMLCISGLLMLASKPVESLLHRGLTTVTAEAEALPASTLLARVQAHYPQTNVRLYLPPQHNTESARFSLTSGAHTGHVGHGSPTTLVYINPYSGEILGSRDPSATFYTLVKNFHGTLLLGRLGDMLIEGAAGLAILMIVSGLYLSWNRQSRDKTTPAYNKGKRKRWRRWHKLSGWFVAAPLLFFLLSGLAWTSIWGGTLVQPWGSLPGTNYQAPKAEHNHSAMNQSGLHQVPWALEQTPMPLSGQANGKTELDAINLIAQQQGFDRYRIHLPQGDSGVWTISASTIVGDINNPLDERIVHIDRATGQVLADITFGDYPAMGKAMAAFIPLHQGDLGLWNLLLNVIIIAMIIVLIVTGITLWWKRRIPHNSSLQPPPANPATSKAVIAFMLVISLCFPVSAALLVLIIVIDWALLSRVKASPAKTR